MQISLLYTDFLFYGYLPSSGIDRKSTRLNSSHLVISYAVFCLKKKKNLTRAPRDFFKWQKQFIVLHNALRHLGFLLVGLWPLITSYVQGACTHRVALLPEAVV